MCPKSEVQREEMCDTRSARRIMKLQHWLAVARSSYIEGQRLRLPLRFRGAISLVATHTAGSTYVQNARSSYLSFARQSSWHFLFSVAFFTRFIISARSVHARKLDNACLVARLRLIKHVNNAGPGARCMIGTRYVGLTLLQKPSRPNSLKVPDIMPSV